MLVYQRRWAALKRKNDAYIFFRQTFPPRFLNSILFYAFPKQRPFSGALGRGWKTVAAALTNRRNIETTAWIPPRVIFFTVLCFAVQLLEEDHTQCTCGRSTVLPNGLLDRCGAHFECWSRYAKWSSPNLLQAYILQSNIHTCKHYMYYQKLFTFVRCYLTGWRSKIILTDVFKVLSSMQHGWNI